MESAAAIPLAMKTPTYHTKFSSDLIPLWDGEEKNEKIDPQLHKAIKHKLLEHDYHYITRHC